MSSLFFKKNVAVNQVSQEGMLKSQSTFVSFYVGDITQMSVDLFSIGPAVAAEWIM